MKKLLILFFSLMIFSFSFSEATFLQGVDTEEIKNILVKDGFQFKSVDQYYFFEKRNGKFEQRVDIYFSNGKPYDIDIVSCHFHTTPNQETVKIKLKEMVEKINKGINNKLLKEEMIKALNKMPATSPKIRPGNMDDLEKINKYYEVGDYSINTSNMETEKSIKISCD